MKFFKSQITFFLSFIIAINAYSQTSTLKQRVENDELSREKKINTYIAQNNVQKRVVYNEKTYVMYDIVDNKPIYKSLDNETAALVTKANHLQVGGSLGLDLRGSGITVGVFDGGPVQTDHVEFQNPENSGTRITNYDSNNIVDGGTGFEEHATHVSGTIGATGNYELAKGMATDVSIITYNFSGDTGKMIAVQDNSQLDVFLSNHSYGIDINQTSGQLDAWNMGAYANGAATIDAIARDYPYYLMVFSAGNNGTTNYTGGLYSGYDKLTGDKNAKNNLVVANANALVNAFTGEIISIAMNGSSSQGPTDDLRIKPDITGYGSGVLSTIPYADELDDKYGVKSGTSMSAPNVTGTLILIQEHYKNVNEDIMKSATLKALVCHTAEDDEITTGPDPKYGWGVLDSKKSAELITDDSNGDALISELTLENEGTFELDFSVSSGQKLVATIAWTDAPGISASGAADLNDPTPKLVNDLDIRLVKDGTTYFPWSLVYDSASGFSNTNTVDNFVDNVEKIEIETPDPGNYTLIVTHKGTLEGDNPFVGGNQNFGLVISGANFQSSLGISSFDDANNLMIWPNPANDILNYSFISSTDSNAIINLYDSQGRVVYKKTKNSIINNVTENIDISNLSSGFYILSIRHGKSIIRKKIIKN